MATQDIDSQIQDHLAAILSLLRQKAIEALGGGLLSASATSRSSARAASKSPRKARQAGKRTPEEVDARAREFANFVTGNPGLRKEQIVKGMNAESSELQRPADRARKLGLVTMKGNRRAAKYYPAGRGSKVQAPRKAKARKTAAKAS